MINKLLCIATFIVYSYTYSQTIHEISAPEEIENLNLNAGDTIILEDGMYDSDERISFLGTGTSDNPITFRPQTPGGVVFTGGLQMNIAGDYLVVDGFYWNGGFGASNFIQFRDGSTYAQNCTIQNCAINNLGVDPDDIEVGTSIKHRWIVLYGNYNNVLNCSFMNKSTSGALVLVELEFNASPEGEDGTMITRCMEVGHTISNNYFYKYDKIDTSLTNAGDSETIRVGESNFQNVNSSTTVSNNYFVEADGENEIISNKSDNNTYANNTFRRCRGSLVLRHGSGATIDRNYFLGENVDGTGGIRVSDSDHIITNNYIQDCITVIDQAIWNNAFTFMGGNTNSVDDCNETSTSNGYQDVEDINISNNTVINTNAPLFYNTNKGKSTNTGIIANNLIYFDPNNTNISNVINGDDTSSYTDIGVTLDYSGNIFSGTLLGETNSGFSSENISLTTDGEIFTHNQAGKGADINEFRPHTDAMVGDGIGACFLDFEANPISDPICTISEIASINIGALSGFNYESNSSIVSVTANVPWTTTENVDWISITPASGIGTGAESVTITVSENTESTDRSGIITFNQTGGGITRSLVVNQSGIDPRSNYILINDDSDNDNVEIEFVFHEEITETKNNIAIHTLDKDLDTQWSGMNVDDVPGEIIFDLGGSFDLALVDYAATSGKTYEFQIWVSTTGIEASDFINAFPDEGNADGNLTSNTTGEFKSFELSSIIENVRYVKVIGYGQPLRPSPWNTITEIEFYRRSSVLSIDEYISAEELGVSLYPNPVTNSILNIEATLTSIHNITIYDALGGLIKNERLDTSGIRNRVDVSNLEAGLYFVEMSNGTQKTIQKIIISK